MASKIKALGLIFGACTALSAFVPASAWAETGGHFTSDSSNKLTVITGTESGTHTTELTAPGLTGIVCEEAGYEGTAETQTVESITIAPKYAKCKTTGGTAGEVSVDRNECTFEFTIGKKASADNTVDLVCPGVRRFITITHPSCEIRIPAQNNMVGIAYNTTVENSKHSITVGVTVKGFTTHFEASFCTLLGTKQVSELTGSVTVQGFEDLESGAKEGPQVNITATGSEGGGETEGHFTSDATTASTIIKGTESGTHTTELTVPGLTGIVCEEASYKGTATGATVESITITPKYSKCKTTGGSENEVTIDLNGCNYQFTIGKKSTADNTVDLVCPGTTKYITITHPACEIRIPAQNNMVGVAYNTTVENSKHSITLGVTVQGFTTHFESGFCVLLNTKQVAEITGSVTVQGFEDVAGSAGNQVNITATGSEG